MKKDISLTSAINEISQVKDIDKDLIIQTLEKTIVDAAKKKYPQYSNIEAQLMNQKIVIFFSTVFLLGKIYENNEIACIIRSSYFFFYSFFYWGGRFTYISEAVIFFSTVSNWGGRFT